MDFSQFDPKTSLIVTASRRQSRFIREQYQNHQAAQSKKVWHSLQVMPWSAFLNKCWSYCQSMNLEPSLPIRLSVGQSRYLWGQIVESSQAAQDLLNKKQTVNLSYDGWRNLCQWQIDEFDFLPGDEDQSAFAAWYRSYQDLLNRNNWIDPFQQANMLLNQLTGFIGLIPENIGFYGFQQASPQQTSLMNAISAKKTVTFIENSANKNSQLSVKAAVSQEHEWVAAVRWAKQKIIAGEKNIAIIIPELERVRSNIDRILQQELYPESFMEGKINHSLHDISVDEPLLMQPMTCLFKDILDLLTKKISKAQLQNLLLSPYLYQDKNKHWSATKLELLVRKFNRNYYSLETIAELAAKQQIELDWLDSIIHSVNTIHEKSKGLLSYSEFIEYLLDFLSQLHWSGYHVLSSREFQLQQSLLEQIKASANMQRVLEPQLTVSRSIKVLIQHLENQGFHQESPQAPIKVMGLLEAVGLQVNAAWLLGATDTLLPQKANPNPFLSKAVQLKHQMPGSSQQREIDYAQAIISSLLTVPDLVVSYALQDSEQEQLLSPLIAGVAASIEVLEAIPLSPEFLTEIENNHLQLYQDHQGLALSDEDFARGGTALLKTQAASPFDAYVRYRLNAYPLEQDPLGISFMERGNLFHQLMQLIWQHLQDQKTLLAYSEQALNDVINRSIETVLKQASRHLPVLHHENFYQIEKQRLYQLASESLQLDKERSEFRVLACEAKRLIEVGGLKLQITIDRIDELPDGSLIIIDYKTGQPKLVDLMNDPIGEPQLLLYAISEHKETSPVTGVLFYQAHLKAGRYIGFTDESEMINGVKALKDLKNNPYANKFDKAIQEWRLMLKQIATDFKQGRADITEYSINYPDHYIISRWQERQLEETIQLSGDVISD